MKLDGPTPSFLSGTAFGSQLTHDGGWHSEGYDGASIVSASSLTSLGTCSSVELDGTGTGAVELDW